MRLVGSAWIGRPVSFVLALLVSLLLAVPVFGEEDEEAAIARLGRIRSKVGREQEALTLLEQRRAGLQRLLNRYEREIEQLNRQRKSAINGVIENAKKQRALREERESTAVKLARVQTRAHRRARALFFLERLEGRGGVHRVVAGDATITERERYFFRKLSEYDQQIVRSLVALRDRLIRQEEELAQLEESGRHLDEELLLKEEKLAIKLNEHQALLKEAAKKSIRLKATLKSLQFESARLEQLITGLTGGEVPSNSFFDESDSPQAPDQEEGYFRGSYQGEGLPDSFPKPIDGEVVSHFGAASLEAFNAAMKRKGVDLAAEENVPLTGVALGVVRFIGTLPGYGKVVIIDHGNRDFTLYGKLGAVLVHLGQQVDKDAAVARLALDPTGKAVVYFEVRRNGEAVDPEQFFAEAVE